MGWLDKLRGVTTAPDTRTHIATLARPFVNQHALEANSKRICSRAHRSMARTSVPARPAARLPRTSRI